MAEDKAELGRRIREQRLKAGLSLEELGKRVGWKRSHMSKIELGERGITAQNYDRIMRALGAAPPTASGAIMDRLLQITQAEGANLELRQVETSRLEPAARAGDAVLVDLRSRRVTVDGIYLLQPAGGGPADLFSVRRLLEGRCRVGLGDGQYEDIAPDKIKPLGRVIWVLRRA